MATKNGVLDVFLPKRSILLSLPLFLPLSISLAPSLSPQLHRCVLCLYPTQRPGVVAQNEVERPAIVALGVNRPCPDAGGRQRVLFVEATHWRQHSGVSTYPPLKSGSEWQDATIAWRTDCIPGPDVTVGGGEQLAQLILT